MLKIVYPICCEMNVHKSFLVACIASTNTQGVTIYRIKRFSTFTGDLQRCAMWLSKNNCHDVCMESTGKYGDTCLQYTGTYLQNCPCPSQIRKSDTW